MDPNTATMEFPRRFLPADVDFGDWSQIEPWMKKLTERPIESAEDLERWLLDRSELEAALSEARARRYIAMTRNTGDEAIEKEYLNFIENVEPKCKPFQHAMNGKFYHCPQRGALDPERYGVLSRNIAAEIEIYREENIPLKTECNKLSQRYQKRCGEMMVEFDGKEQTLPQMAKYLEETDRERRRAAWELTWKRRLQNREEFDEIYGQLIGLRDQIAKNAGFANYRDYAFKMYKRFDYGPDDCMAFHKAAQECVVPLARKIAENRRASLGLDTLRPWDLAVDPLNRPPLKPFETADELCDGAERIFERLDPELAADFRSMRANGELDLESRKGKAPGGYLYCRDEIRRPFIFMNAAGLQRDVETLLHESGHAFHSLATRNEPLLDYRDSPIEFAEVASMSMELFGGRFLEEYYSPAEAARARRNHLEGIVGILPWIARIDDFQHWVHTNPGHSPMDREAYWLELEERYGVNLDWSGREDVRAMNWQRQLHLFVHAFYYIEYGIAQLGALQLWKNYQDDPAEALRRYRAGLALGGTKPLPELFETAGARFDFSIDAIQPLMKLIEMELDAMAP